MKKLFTTCAVALGLCSGANAQMLATFEDGFDNQLELSDEWYEQSLFIVQPEIGTNDVKEGLNTSDKCFKAVNVADADWWGNFYALKLKQPVTITESNRYLKFLAYRSEQPKLFVVEASEGGDFVEIYRGKLKTDGSWQGVVVDVGSAFMNKEVQKFRIIFSANWDDPRTGWGAITYMFDDFQLSDNPLTPGLTPVTDLSDFNIGFESQEVLDKWVAKIDMQNETNSYEIVDNPFTESTVNPGGKVFRFNKSEEASWWQGPMLYLENVLELSPDYKYLHVLVNAPESALNDLGEMVVQICVKDHLGKEHTESILIYDDEVGKWMDLVTEIVGISYVQQIEVRFDLRKDEAGEYIVAPANTFYFDEVTINNDVDPRLEIVNSMNNDLLNVTGIYGGKGNIRIEGINGSNIKIYNTLGTLMNETTLSGEANIPVSNGMYIVEVESEGKRSATKVMVK